MRNIEALGYSFRVEDNWLKETGTIPFSKAGGHYNFKKTSSDVIIAKISEIDPKIRGDGIPIFKDGFVEGQFKSKDERVKDILNAFKENTPLHPVEIEELRNRKYRFKLHHGCHRLHLSILVGYDSIPAMIYFDR